MNDKQNCIQLPVIAIAWQPSTFFWSEQMGHSAFEQMPASTVPDLGLSLRRRCWSRPSGVNRSIPRLHLVCCEVHVTAEISQHWWLKQHVLSDTWHSEPVRERERWQGDQGGSSGGGGGIQALCWGGSICLSVLVLMLYSNVTGEW